MWHTVLRNCRFYIKSKPVRTISTISEIFLADETEKLTRIFYAVVVRQDNDMPHWSKVYLTTKQPFIHIIVPWTYNRTATDGDKRFLMHFKGNIYLLTNIHLREWVSCLGTVWFFLWGVFFSQETVYWHKSSTWNAFPGNDAPFLK